jgi:hypothetical protein
VTTVTFIDLTLGDVGSDDDPIHIRIPGTHVAYCGVSLTDDNSTSLPESEVTDEAWCKPCEAGWGAA